KQEEQLLATEESVKSDEIAATTDVSEETCSIADSPKQQDPEKSYSKAMLKKGKEIITKTYKKIHSPNENPWQFRRPESLSASVAVGAAGGAISEGGYLRT